MREHIDVRRLADFPTSELDRLRAEIAVDDLTGVLRRRAGLSAISHEVDRARLSSDSRLALGFLDVDGLKAVNDTRGHAAGDAALCGVAHALKCALRKQDIIFRYGGDEFVCAFPHMNVELASAVLLDVWRQLSRRGMQTFSAGFAELQDGDDVLRLIGRADECLYAGRRIQDRRQWRFAS